MNKAELTKEVAAETGQTLLTASISVEAVLNAIKKGVTKDGETKVSGFGIFKSVIRKARTGRNPATGETMQLPEKTVVKFKPYF
jgi:DNA-binding protein HU-beta